MDISSAVTADDYAKFAKLIVEYTDWCRARYAQDKWFVDAALGHQSLDKELQNLASKYGPPEGITLLAWEGGTVAGCAAYRRLTPDICEMKRVFVLDQHKGKGIGRRLCLTLMSAASRSGYTRMCLDTANLLTEAIALYGSLGFEPCAPYNDYPDALRPYIVFMDCRLPEAPGGELNS